MIRVIVNGACGRMGKMITQGVSEQEDMQIVGAIEFSEHPQLGQDVGEVAGIGTIGVPITQNVVDAGKRMVIATTGYDEEELAQVHALAPQIPCVMASNMSVGINVMLQAIQLVANVLGADYDVEVIEAHHNQKVDSPSGTALRMAEVLAQTLDRNLSEVGVYGRHGIVGKRTKKEIGIHAIRGGDLAGDHTVLFVGTGDRLEITHRGQNREPLARGAIRAARWVMGAPKGLHDIAEVLF